MEGNNKDTFEEFKKLRDEFRVKIHLGEMDVKEWWAEVEPKMVELEATLERGTERATGAARVLIDELTEAFRKIREGLKDINN